MSQNGEGGGGLFLTFKDKLEKLPLNPMSRGGELFGPPPVFHLLLLE